MYFNEENNETNIDQEFNNSPKRNFNFSLNKKMLLIIGIIVVVIIGIILLSKINKTEYYLVLNGLEDMTIYQNTTFVDPGYTVYDNKDNDYTSEVIVSGEVNESVAGEYVIQYQFNEIVKERVVTVIGEVNQVTFLNLLGNQVIYLKVNEGYQEPGYIVLDSVDENIQNKVKVSGEVNTQKAGTYKITYSVVNSSNITVTAERTIIVMDSDVSVSYSPTEFTNGEVVVTINVVSNYFDYILLPDGTRSINRLTNYNVSSNGEYKFEIYSKDGSVQENSVQINNIDKTLPVISNCLAKVSSSNTNITVTASDSDAGVNMYNYYVNGSLIKQTSSNSYTHLSTNVNDVKIKVVDKAGNESESSCSISKPLPSSSSKSSSSKSSSSSKQSSSSKKSSSSSSNTSYVAGGTKYYTAFGHQYVIPNTKNDLRTFANMVDGKISQTALSTCHSNCLSVSQYHAYMIQHGALGEMNVQDACNWKHATKLKTIFFDTSKEVLYKVYEEINAGKVIIVQVKGSAGRHFALAVGYRSRVKRKEDMTEADLLIIDSWDGKLETMDKAIAPNGRILWRRSNQGWRVDVLK